MRGDSQELILSSVFNSERRSRLGLTAHSYAHEEEHLCTRLINVSS